MFIKQFGIDKGKIELLGQNYVLFDALALFEIQKIDETKLYEVMKNTSFKNISDAVKFAKVYKNVKDTFITNIAKLGAKIGKSDEGVLMTLKDLFNVYGLGNMEMLKLENDKKQALVKMTGSTVATEYKNKYKKSTSSVDLIAAGILAGIFSYVFKKPVDCVEQKCIAKGDEFCEFEIA
jgi:predicted hydrocarbon binding protein